MAMPGGQFFVGADRFEESVWVVVDPRDVVTGDRVRDPLAVGFAGGTAKPIAARSGVYCFLDLTLPPAEYVVEVRPLGRGKTRYFEATEKLTLVKVPVAGQPLARNPVVVPLLPRPEYPFDPQRTLLRGRLIKASDKSPVPGATVTLLSPPATDLGPRARTDERGAFAVCFPGLKPGDNSNATPQPLSYLLRFELDALAHTTPLVATVLEGTTKVLPPVEFPGI
jgi:hypothetical protein